jgi:hypothetical protein
VQNKERPAKLNPCPGLFTALLYRSWHSDPHDRTSLSFIKTVLRLILNALPRTPQVHTIERINNLKERWLNDLNLPKKYIPTEPQLDNQQSMNIYQEHLNVMERIVRIQKDINKLELINMSYDRYYEVSDENQQLQIDIDMLRVQKNS